MYFLLIVTLSTAFFARHLVKSEILPSVASYLPEICSLIMAAVITFRAFQNPERIARAAYLGLFAALALISLGGIFVNDVSAGIVFAALRSYLVALPLFLFPFFYPADEKTLRRAFWFLILCAIVQIPVAYEQRMFTSFQGETTGDWTIGTIGNSGMLSIFLILIVCLVTAAYAKRIFGFFSFFILTVLVMFPTMLNETKATVLLAPTAMLVILAVGSDKGARVKSIALGTVVLLLFGTIFVQVYDYFMVPRWGYGLVDFFLMEGRVEGYLSKGATVGSSKAGHLDGLLQPIIHVHQEIVRWAFGYGAGNISDSALGSQFRGRYFAQFDGLSVGTAGLLILELGFPAFILALLFVVMIANDSFRASESNEGMTGVFALAATGAASVMFLMIVYKNVLLSPAICFLFAFLAGQAVSCKRVVSTGLPAKGALMDVTPNRQLSSRELGITRGNLGNSRPV